jgi:hypothetical protein
MPMEWAFHDWMYINCNTWQMQINCLFHLQIFTPRPWILPGGQLSCFDVISCVFYQGLGRLNDTAPIPEFHSGSLLIHVGLSSYHSISQFSCKVAMYEFSLWHPWKSFTSTWTMFGSRLTSVSTLFFAEWLFSPEHGSSNRAWQPSQWVPTNHRSCRYLMMRSHTVSLCTVINNEDYWFCSWIGWWNVLMYICIRFLQLIKLHVQPMLTMLLIYWDMF